MKWSNVYKLPEPFANLISEDLYHEERHKQFLTYCADKGLDHREVVHYSASDLIKPPRMRMLFKRYDSKIMADISNHIYRILGTAIHTCLRLSAIRMMAKGLQGYTPEERLFAHMEVDGRHVVISGEPDLLTPDGWIHDYKVTGVFALNHGIKEEWEQATNIYAWLRRANGQSETKGILITFILRDWKKSETVQEGYPPSGGQTMEAKLRSPLETGEFILSRVKAHLAVEIAFDDELPDCTKHEMWEKPEAWAVIREGGARAAKLWKGEDFPEGTEPSVVQLAASADSTNRNTKLKKGDKPYVVEHRPGERTRCLNYCEARQFCSSFKEYRAAAFASIAHGQREEREVP